MQAQRDGGEVDAAVEAIVKGVYDSGALYDPHRWWPRSYLPYSPLFAADFHSQWLERWREIPRQAVEPYARSTAIWVLLAMASRSLKALFDERERMSVFLALLDDIRSAKAGDPFCRDGRHLVLKDDEAQAIVDRLPFADADERPTDRAYAGLNATLLAFSEAVFFSANCTVREVHGPYPVRYGGEPRQLLVRDYYRLRDQALEPATADVPYDAVRTYSIYDETVRFEFTVLNDYTSDRPLGTAAVAHAVELSRGDEVWLAEDADAVREVTVALSATIAAVGARIADTAPADETVEIVRRTYYRASPIAEAVGGNWEPRPEFILDFRAALDDFHATTPPSMTREEFGVMVDPRK
jgi:hypothetical protein